MGSPKVEAPKPTAEENALRVEQTELLRQQREILLSQNKQQQMLLPIFAQQMGLDLQMNPDGSIGKVTQNPQFAAIQKMQQELTMGQLEKAKADAELDPQRRAIEKALLERSQKALAGELEVDPALERDIGKQEQILRDRLRSQFGSGYESSSPGIEALQNFAESSNVLRSGARTGQLTLAEQLGLARQGADMAQGQSNMGLSQSQFQQQMAERAQLGQVLGAPMSIASGLGSAAQGYQMPIGQLQNYSQMKMQANIANAQNSMGLFGGIGSIFGSILGAL